MIFLSARQLYARAYKCPDQPSLGSVRTRISRASRDPIELRAARNEVASLQAQLKDTEDKISYMRQSYNDTVMNFNNAIQTFPGVLFAGMFGFAKRTLFEAGEAANNVPVVQF